jgi:TetR/AcrR family transcriptional regulator, cholesterol catabolism regulator
MTEDPLVLRFVRVFESEPELAHLSGTARRVLSVAASVFYPRGSAATSMRDLAAACGLSAGALYNHFEGRDELLYVLVRTAHVRVERALVAAVAEAGEDPVARFEHFVTSYTDRHLVFPEFAQLVHREYVQLSDPRRAEIVERRRRIRGRLVAILREGERAGVFSLIGGEQAAVGQAMMVMDMCSRTSEWFSPSASSAGLTERYVRAALRLVGADHPGQRTRRPG